jgi:uncharacterized glyoxalase superfamily protein PhnB
MKPAPKGWPRISSALFYDDARQAIDWLGRAFGFELKLLVEGDGGRVEHSELTFGEGLIMVGATQKADYRRSPKAIGSANTQCLMIYVDDVEAHCARARAAGATILREPETHDYGSDYWSDRGYECADPEGHRFWFMQRLRG